MITREFVTRYQEELEYLYDQGAEFAKRYQGIATQLGLSGSECHDPLVKQLLEGVAFLTAKLSEKVDAEFPKFTQHLLEVIGPELLSPIPSMAMVQFQPDFADDALRKGYRLACDEVLSVKPVQTRECRTNETCFFTVRKGVTLWPIQVTNAVYTEDLSGYRYALKGFDEAKSAVVVSLSTTNGQLWCDLPLDALLFYLDMPVALLNTLLENMHHPRAAFVLVDEAKKWASDWCWAKDVITLSGFDEEEPLLPARHGFFSGLRILQEYFCFPNKFRFLKILGLPSVLQRMRSTSVDVIFCFEDTLTLGRDIHPNHFKLHCAPVANVFKKSGKHIQIKPTLHEYSVTIDANNSQDIELYSIIGVEGFRSLGQSGETIDPYYTHTHGFAKADRPTYTIRRCLRRLSGLEKQRGPRSTYLGSEVYLQLDVPQEAFPGTRFQSIAVEAWCTNRDLPLLIKIGEGGAQFQIHSNAPIEHIHCLVGPTEPKPSHTDRQNDWKLIALLSPNFIGLRGSENEQALCQLKRLLSLYLPEGTSGSTQRALLDGLLSFETQTVQRVDNTTLPPSLLRGIRIEIRLKLNAFDGHCLFLFGQVLSELLSRFTGLHSFTELRVLSVPQQFDFMWKPHMGTKRWL